MKYFSCFFILLSTISTAQTRINRTILNLPTFDQGGLGTCWSYTASASYTALYKAFYKEDINPSPFFSALHRSMHNKDQHKERKTLTQRMQGGNYCSAIENYGKDPKHYCSQKAVEQFFYNSTTNKVHFNRGMILFEKYIQFFSQSKSKNKLNDFYKEHKVSKLERKWVQKFDAFLRTKGVKKSLFKNIRKKATIYNFFASRCHEFSKKKKRKPLQTLKLRCHEHLVTRKNSKTLSREMHEHLNYPNPFPVEIRYCSKHLLYKKSLCGLHSSLVYGTKHTKTGIYFLVRNSWIEGHTSKKNTIPIIREATDITSYRLAGNFWIHEKVLLTAWNAHGTGFSTVDID